VVAVLLGWLLASEGLSMRVVFASIAILGAIVLIRRGEGTTARRVPVEHSGKVSVEECA
jgi:drug/metabolite transporter (DMT)-like permease